MDGLPSAMVREECTSKGVVLFGAVSVVLTGTVLSRLRGQGCQSHHTDHETT